MAISKKHKSTAYLLIRLTMGFNFFGHGLARLPKINGFRDWMVETFQNSILPSWTVWVWGSVLPILEFSIGILLILGLYTFRAATVGGFVIAILIFGSCLIEKWEWAGAQMLYALFYYFLITFEQNNTLSIDKLINKNQ